MVYTFIFVMRRPTYNECKKNSGNIRKLVCIIQIVHLFAHMLHKWLTHAFSWSNGNVYINQKQSQQQLVPHGQQIEEANVIVKMNSLIFSILHAVAAAFGQNQEEETTCVRATVRIQMEKTNLCQQQLDEKTGKGRSK